MLPPYPDPADPFTTAPAHVPESVPVWGDHGPLDLPPSSRQSETIASPPVLRRTSIWGVPLAALTYHEAVECVEELVRGGQPGFFVTANLHYAMLTDRDPRLRRVNQKAAFIVADGMPLVWYSRFRGPPLPARVTGADLLHVLCERAANRGYGVFLLGGSPGVADHVAEILRHRYPGLRIVGTAAPELDWLSPQEHQQLIDRIRNAEPQLLLAALGQPKGEIWLADHCEALGVPACVQVGASFDFVAGRLRRAPKWMQQLGLEWLFRVLCEPKRLLPRYFADARFLLRAVLSDVFETLRARRSRR